MNPEKLIHKLITQTLPDARIEIEDMNGTGDHFEITVVSEGFRGKSLLEQHRMIFSVLEKEMEKSIHAVKLKTKVPS